MRVIAYVVAGTALLGVSCQSDPSPTPFQPVADTSLLMEAIVDPLTDVIWDAVGTKVTPDGTTEIRPETTEEWNTVRNSALTLAESGNLLMMSPRAVDDDEWMKAATALVDTGMLAVSAAEAQDAEQLFEAGRLLYGVCSNCHQRYWADALLLP